MRTTAVLLETYREARVIALATLTVLLAAPPAPAGAPAPQVVPVRIGRLEHPAIREASGVVRSRRHPGVYWVHNDSGNPPALFAVRADGSLIREYVVAAPNVDWEDIAADDQGHLYLADTGNNNNRLPVRAVYVLDEPDPAAAGPTPALKVKTATYYRFPEEGRFDAEGLVIVGGRALIFAKTKDGREAEVYSVPLDPPAPLIRPAVPIRAGTLKGFLEPVTGASLTADGRRLVVCSLRSVGVFQADDSGGWTPVSLRGFTSDDQVEGVCWDGDDLLLVGEGRGVWRIAARDWRSP